MFHSNPLISASLAVTLAAGVAGIFTVATSSASREVDRTAATDRHAAEHGLSTIMFDAQPIAGSGQMLNDPASILDSSRNTMTEQILPQRTDDRHNGPPAKGCDSGLSPDLVPLAKAVRCFT
jgi:hypothetical protein